MAPEIDSGWSALQKMEALQQRVEVLERLVRDLATALIRQGSDLDGNWGNPPSGDEFVRIGKELSR